MTSYFFIGGEYCRVVWSACSVAPTTVGKTSTVSCKNTDYGNLEAKLFEAKILNLNLNVKDPFWGLTRHCKVKKFYLI